MDRTKASYAAPLLNQGNPYIPEAGRTKEDDVSMIYDTKSIVQKQTHISKERFNQIYKSMIRFFTEQEQISFNQYQAGEKDPKEFYRDCSNRLKRDYPDEMSNLNDFTVMLERINMAIFQYDVLQPLIDNPEMSDISVCGFNDIGVRIKGKSYQSNIGFIDNADLFRFVDGLSIRNHINIYDHPTVIFTDTHDRNYILRFTVSPPSTNAVDYPYLHIRKISKTKKFYKQLIQENMLNNDVMLYMIDRAKSARGVIFAGPPGSGKTTHLNAFIEHIPKIRDTLVIQESDELFTDQPRFKFKHVAYGYSGEPVCTLEDLGRYALVEGCNEFIIGEVKGREINAAINLANTGSYVALSVHALSAYEVLDRMADLSGLPYEESRRKLKAFDTIVYMEGYKVREILEIDGYDESTKKFHYINIYRYMD